MHYWKHKLAEFFDPCLTILEVVILALLSYKYGKLQFVTRLIVGLNSHNFDVCIIAREAGYILLLTIPDHINVQTLLDELYDSFPEIKNIHEFHVWQLTPARIIASAHLVFQNTKDCWIIQNNVTEFLQSKGISQVTLQPEFMEVINCIM